MRRRFQNGVPDLGTLYSLACRYINGRVRPEEALKLARQVVERQPNNLAFQNTLGWALFRNGDYQGALARFIPALRPECR